MSRREKILLIILGSIILFIAGVSFFAYRYDNQYSEYNNKTYRVSSADGKISGTIKTTVNACSETERCVRADYNLILTDSLPQNIKGAGSSKDSYFDPNYLYAVNIYNNQLNPKEVQFDSNIKPIDKSLPANTFKISFWKILYSSKYSQDAFKKFTHLDIYDVSNPAYLDKFGFVDELAPLKSTDKIKSYDFIVSSSGEDIKVEDVVNNNNSVSLPKNKQQNTVNYAATCGEAKNPEDVATCFYDESIRYIKAVKEGSGYENSMGLFSGGPGDKYVIRKELQNNQTQFYNSDFSKNISTEEKMKGYQYIICSSRLPESFSIENVDIKNTEAVVNLKLNIGTDKKTIQVFLKKDSDLWKIYKIYCPQ